jgi:hypothetical protein
MSNLNAPLNPQAWVTHLFSSKAACEGRVIRRNIRDIEHFIGRQAFEQELTRRGFHAVENAGQMIIFCNQEPVWIIS